MSISMGEAMLFVGLDSSKFEDGLREIKTETENTADDSEKFWKDSLGRTRDEFGRFVKTTNSQLDKIPEKVKGIAGKMAKAFGDGFDAADESLQALAQNAGRAFGIITNPLALATAGFATLSAGIGSSIGVAADFEQQMGGVMAVMQNSGRSMDELRELALEMGSATAFSSSQAANGMEELAKAGVSADEIFGGALENTLNLATSTGLKDLGQAANIAASAMNVFGLSGKQLEGVGDVISNFANESTMGVEDFAQAMASGGSVARSTGLDIKDFAGVMSVLSSNFQSGQDMGTAFKTMLLALKNPSDEAKKVMKEIGLNAYTSTGQMRPFTDIVGDLQKGMKNLTPEARDAAMATIFGADAIRAALPLYEAGAEGLEKATDAMAKSGTAADASEIRMNNFKGAMEALGGSIEVLQIRVGDLFLPILTELAKRAMDVVNVVANLVKWFTAAKTAVEEMLRPYIDAITQTQLFQQASEALRIALGVLAGAGGVLLLTKALRDLSSTITGLVRPAILWLYGALAPFLVPLAAVAAGVAALYLAWRNNFLGIKDVVQTIVDAVRVFMARLPIYFTAVQDTLRILGTAWSVIWGGIVKIVSGFADIINHYVVIPTANMVTAIGQGISTAGNIIAGWVKGIGQAIQPVIDFFNSIGMGISNFVTGAANTIGNFFSGLLGQAKEGARAAKEALKESAGETHALTIGLNKIDEGYAQIVRTASSAGIQIGYTWGFAHNQAKALIPNIQALNKSVSNNAESIVNLGKEIQTTVDVASELPKAFTGGTESLNALNDAGSKTKELTTAQVAALVDKAYELQKALENAKGPQAIKKAALAIDAFKRANEGANDALSIAKQMLDAEREAADKSAKAKEAARKAVKDFSGSMLDLISNMRQQIKEGKVTRDSLDKWGDAISEARNKLKALGIEVPDIFNEVIKSLKKGAQETILANDATARYEKTIKNMLNSLNNYNNEQVYRMMLEARGRKDLETEIKLRDELARRLLKEADIRADINMTNSGTTAARGIQKTLRNLVEGGGSLVDIDKALRETERLMATDAWAYVDERIRRDIEGLAVFLKNRMDDIANTASDALTGGDSAILEHTAATIDLLGQELEQYKIKNDAGIISAKDFRAQQERIVGILEFEQSLVEEGSESWYRYQRAINSLKSDLKATAEVKEVVLSQILEESDRINYLNDLLDKSKIAYEGGKITLEQYESEQANILETLENLQKETAEGSDEWYAYQRAINSIKASTKEAEEGLDGLIEKLHVLDIELNDAKDVDISGLIAGKEQIDPDANAQELQDTLNGLLMIQDSLGKWIIPSQMTQLGDLIKLYTDRIAALNDEVPHVGPGFLDTFDESATALGMAQDAIDGYTGTMKNLDERLKAGEITTEQYATEWKNAIDALNAEGGDLERMGANITQLKQTVEDATEALRVFGLTSREAVDETPEGFDISDSGLATGEMAMAQDEIAQFQAQLAELEQQFNSGEISTADYVRQWSALINGLNEARTVYGENSAALSYLNGNIDAAYVGLERFIQSGKSVDELTEPYNALAETVARAEASISTANAAFERTGDVDSYKNALMDAKGELMQFLNASDLTGSELEALVGRIAAIDAQLREIEIAKPMRDANAELERAKAWYEIGVTGATQYKAALQTTINTLEIMAARTDLTEDELITLVRRIKELKKEMGELEKETKTTFLDLFQMFGDGLQTIGNSLKGVFDETQQHVADAIAGIGGLVQKGIQLGTTIARAAAGDITAIFSAVVQGITFIIDLVKWFIDLFSADARRREEELRKRREAAWNAGMRLLEKYNKIIERGKEAFNEFRDNFGNDRAWIQASNKTMKWLKTIAKYGGAGFVEAWTETFTQVAKAMESVLTSGFAEALRGFIETGDVEALRLNVRNTLRDAIVNGIVEALMMAGAVQGTLGPLFGQLSEAFTKAVQTGDFSATHAIIDQIIGTADGLAQNMERVLGPFRGKLAGLFPTEMNSPEFPELNAVDVNLAKNLNFNMPPAVQVAVATPLLESAREMGRHVENFGRHVDRLGAYLDSAGIADTNTALRYGGR